MFKNKVVVTGVVALIVGAGVGYFGAGAFAKSPAPSAASGFARGNFAGGTASTTAFARGGAGGGANVGTIADVANGSITLSLAGNNSKVVLVNSSTAITETVTGSLSDLTVGANVIVTGTTNSDGSITATSIELRPAGSFAATTPATGTAQ